MADLKILLMHQAACRLTREHYAFAPQPNSSVKPTPKSSACRFPARLALRCGLPVAVGPTTRGTADAIYSSCLNGLRAKKARWLKIYANSFNPPPNTLTVFSHAQLLQAMMHN